MSDASTAAEASRRNQVVIVTCCVAAIGGFLFGFDSGVINGTVDGLKQDFGANSAGTGFAVASMLLGCALGAFFAGRLADLVGRRTLLLVSAVLFIISAWGSGVAGTAMMFVVYRVLGGLAVGAASVMSPAYISEIAPAAVRGRLATVQQIAIIGGLFFSFLNNYVLAHIAGASTEALWFGYEAWRCMFWMELLPAIVFLVALMFIPESPRYLVAAGRRDDAHNVLRKVHAADDAQRRLGEIEQSLSLTRRPRLLDIVNTSNNNLYRVVWVGIGLAVFQQLVGINVVFYYGAVLWQAVGFSENDALLINVISGAVSIFACLAAIAVIDRVGRKPLLWVGSAGMTVTLGLMVYAFASGALVDGSLALPGRMGLLALISANAYVFFFNASWGPVMWVMLGEMFPNRLRGSGLAIAGLCQWLANFAITLTFPIMLAGVGLAGAYGFYAVCALLSLIFVVFFIRETKGRELEEMGYE
ncbi:MAG: MFS transporter [Xanthomonadales bacterium]|nr:MFS transporter [Xanthomonadales bacterium]